MREKKKVDEEVEKYEVYREDQKILRGGDKSMLRGESDTQSIPLLIYWQSTTLVLFHVSQAFRCVLASLYMRACPSLTVGQSVSRLVTCLFRTCQNVNSDVYSIYQVFHNKYGLWFTRYYRK